MLFLHCYIQGVSCAAISTGATKPSDLSQTAQGSEIVTLSMPTLQFRNEEMGRQGSEWPFRKSTTGMRDAVADFGAGNEASPTSSRRSAVTDPKAMRSQRRLKPWGA